MPDKIPPQFSKAQNLPTFWSALFVNELYRSGLRHVIISPGSRSTPLTMAFAMHSGIQKHVAVDERSAAFMALGIGMESGAPAALVCTSGTAVANYFPAVIEARMSGIPMLVLSADRPPSLRNNGANQSIRQDGLFGEYPVFSHDAGEPVNAPNDFRRMEILANQCWESSVYQHGPVHINFPFRKPLEPESAFLKDIELYYGTVLEQRPDPLTSSVRVKNWHIPAEILTEIAAAHRPVLLAGPLCGYPHLEHITTSLQSLGIPALREAGSFRFGSKTDSIIGFNAFLKSEETRSLLASDLIIRVGSMPTGKGLELYLDAHKNTLQIRFSGGSEWSDPSVVGGKLVHVPVFESLDAPKAGTINAKPKWAQKWHEISQKWSELREKNLNAGTSLRDGDVHHCVMQHLESSHNVMVSNSFSARDIDLFGAPMVQNHRMFMSRGASGIDGISSTAIGISLSSDKPTVLITGDLAFLHDTTALLSARLLQLNSLRIIVINNNGGSIFRMLPVYTEENWFNTYFETPQHVNFRTICAGFNLEAQEVTTLDELDRIIRKPATNGVSVIVCHTDSDASMQQRQELWKQIL